MKKLIGYHERIFDVSLHQTSIAVACGDGSLRVEKMPRKKKKTKKFTAHKDEECLRTCWLTPTLTASAGSDGCVRVWEKALSKAEVELTKAQEQIYGLRQLNTVHVLAGVVDKVSGMVYRGITSIF